MRKTLLLIVVGLFALGCAPAKDGTCPHRKAESQEPSAQPAPDSDKHVKQELDEAPQPASTGFGEDPGEETQE